MKDESEIVRIAAVALVVLLCSVGAIADKRNGSVGAWHKGEFSEGAYASRWGYGATDQGSINVVTADASRKVAGAASIKLDTTSGFDTWVYFPDTKDMDFDVSQATAFRFSVYTENKNGWGNDPWVIFRDTSGREAKYEGTSNRLSDAMKDWVQFAIPLGKGADLAKGLWKATVETGFSWKHIASLEIHSDTYGYGFLMWYDDVKFVTKQPAKWWLSSIQKPDLSVTYAQQFPRHDRYFPNYDKGYPEITPEHAKDKHLPAVGEKVTYKVHVRNVGRVKSPATDFACTIDGKMMKTARIPTLAPRQETTVDVAWKWKNGPCGFEARVDTKHRIDEISKKNNSLTFKTDAYRMFAICEKGMTEKVDLVNNAYGSYSWEDWLRGSTIDAMNRTFVKSTYDFAPKGALCTVRVDGLYVVNEIKDDTQSKIAEISTYDGGWSYPTKSTPEYCDLANTYMWALNHELAHQLGVIDDYQLDMGADRNKVNGKAFSQPEGGVMGGGHIGKHSYPAYADMDVAGMNATYGYRRGYFGEYLYNVPDENTLMILACDDPTAPGATCMPLPDADIEIHQKNGDEGMKGPPVFTGKTEGNGAFLLPNRPVPLSFTTLTGCRLKPNPFGLIDVVGRNGLFMVRANSGGKWYYGFIDIGHFTVEYARGNGRSATYTVELQAE